MTNVVSAMFLFLSLLTACGSDESVVQNSPVKPPHKEQNFSDTLPSVQETYRQVVVVPWEALTSQKYLRLKTHAFLESEKALVVSILVPGENWFYSPPAGLIQARQKFTLDPARSTKQIDVYARSQTKTTKVTKYHNRRSSSTTYTHPYRFEIKLYKNINGAYTGECDYSVQFQVPATWSGMNEIYDSVIHQSCPLHKVMEYDE